MNSPHPHELVNVMSRSAIFEICPSGFGIVNDAGMILLLIAELPDNMVVGPVFDTHDLDTD